MRPQRAICWLIKHDGDGVTTLNVARSGLEFGDLFFVHRSINRIEPYTLSHIPTGHALRFGTRLICVGTARLLCDCDLAPWRFTTIEEWEAYPNEFQKALRRLIHWDESVKDALLGIRSE